MAPRPGLEPRTYGLSEARTGVHRRCMRKRNKHFSVVDSTRLPMPNLRPNRWELWGWGGGENLMRIKGLRGGFGRTGENDRAEPNGAELGGSGGGRAAAKCRLFCVREPVPCGARPHSVEKVGNSVPPGGPLGKCYSAWTYLFRIPPTPRKSPLFPPWRSSRAEAGLTLGGRGRTAVELEGEASESHANNYRLHINLMRSHYHSTLLSN